MPAFTRENLPFSFTFFGHCIPLLYPSDKNGHNRADSIPLPLRTVRIPSEEASPFIKLTRLHTLIDAGRGGGSIRVASLLRPRSNAARRILRACPELRHADHRRTALGKYVHSESDPLSAVGHVLRAIQSRRKVGPSES